MVAVETSRREVETTPLLGELGELGELGGSREPVSSWQSDKAVCHLVGWSSSIFHMPIDLSKQQH